MSKIAIFSDIHLGLRKDSEDWFKYSEKWIDYFIENNKNIDTVFFLGDWFHYWTNINVMTLKVGSLLMKKLSNNFKNVYVIVGNHDCYLKDSSIIHSLEPFKQWNNINIIDTTTELVIDDKKILMVPWNGEIFNKKYDYIFGHFEIINFYFNKNKICENGTQSKELLNRSKYIFSGHFHMMHEKEFKSGKIIYVGSPFKHDYNDIGNKNGYFILDLKKEKYEFMENPENEFPNFLKFNISDIKKLVSSKEDYTNTYLTIKIDKKITDSNIDKVKNKLLIPLKFKNINFDLKNFDMGVDYTNSHDNIETIDIHSSINEFVDSMNINYKGEIKKLIEQKIINYEQ